MLLIINFNHCNCVNLFFYHFFFSIFKVNNIFLGIKIRLVIWFDKINWWQSFPLCLPFSKYETKALCHKNRPLWKCIPLPLLLRSWKRSNNFQNTLNIQMRSSWDPSNWSHLLLCHGGEGRGTVRVMSHRLNKFCNETIRLKLNSSTFFWV